MTTEYKYRGIFLVPSSKKSAVNSAVKSSLDEEGGEFTFTIGASANGQGSPTYYYANSALTEDALETIAGMANSFSSTKSWIWVDHQTGDADVLNNIFDSVSNIQVEEITLDEVLSENNLQRMEIE